ncbi:MAG: transporter [Planctomycetota bacterium]|nr:transporter [Planctomycetota bacterium]
MQKGGFRLDTSFQYHKLSRLVYGDDYVSFSELSARSPKAAEHGDAEFQLIQTDITLRYALADLTEISLFTPYKWVTLRVDEDDEHHRDETFDGVGDLRLGLRHYVAFEPSYQISIFAGLSVPTGRLNKVTAASYLGHEEAHDLGVIVPKHSHLQLGTGTFDPTLGINVLVRLDDHWMLFGNISATFPLYENRYDYQTAPSATFTFGPALKLEQEPIILGFYTEVFWSGRDKFDGDDIVGPDGVFDGSFGVPNTGRFEIALRPALTWGIREDLTLTVYARFPVYTRIRESSDKSDVQLAEEYGLFIGFSYNF